jgi:hypothetical protein
MNQTTCKSCKFFAGFKVPYNKINGTDCLNIKSHLYQHMVSDDETCNQYEHYFQGQIRSCNNCGFNSNFVPNDPPEIRVYCTNEDSPYYWNKSIDNRILCEFHELVDTNKLLLVSETIINYDEEN